MQKVPATIDLGAAGVRRGIKYIYASRLFKKSKGVRVAPHGAVEEVERVVAHAVPISPTMTKLASDQIFLLPSPLWQLSSNRPKYFKNFFYPTSQKRLLSGPSRARSFASFQLMRVASIRKVRMQAFPVG